MKNKFTTNEELKELYQKMAELTKERCLKDCHQIDGHIGSCCDNMYCEMAKQNAKDVGVILQKPDSNKVRYIGVNGCVVPPYLRPLCTTHICEKSLCDIDFYNAYFKLRELINDEEDKEFLKEESK